MHDRRTARVDAGSLEHAGSPRLEPLMGTRVTAGVTPSVVRTR
jgi:hypothetical protein